MKSQANQLLRHARSGFRSRLTGLDFGFIEIDAAQLAPASCSVFRAAMDHAFLFLVFFPSPKHCEFTVELAVAKSATLPQGLLFPPHRFKNGEFRYRLRNFWFLPPRGPDGSFWRLSDEASIEIALDEVFAGFLDHAVPFVRSAISDLSAEAKSSAT